MIEGFRLKLLARIIVAIVLTATASSLLAATSQPINVAAEGLGKTAELKNWKVRLESPNKIGTLSRGLFCTGSLDMAYNKTLDQFLIARMVVVFKEKTKQLGYPRFQGSDSAFADNSTSSAADLRVGFSLTALSNTLCYVDKEVSGNAQITLKAELYSPKLQKVVYARAIEGRFAADSRVKESVFYDGLLGNALDQMFADPAYVDSFRDNAPVPVSEQLESIAVKNGAKPKEKTKDNVRALQSVVVTIETGSSSGSGFFIGRDGYIITARHVVGDSKYVKVRLLGGFTVPGEVVRKDSARDVALIKTDIDPPLSQYVRLDIAKTGDEVYAIGSPFGAQLNSTVTRGVFSAVRKVDELIYIQSDVAVNPGNSGGPMYDADGGVIGVAVSKMKNAEGINMFIPINDALEKLGVRLQ
jgi:S1-C subfamily serine protease